MAIEGRLHEYMALDHEQNEESIQTPEGRSSQEESSAQNHLLDHDDSSGGTTGSSSHPTSAQNIWGKYVRDKAEAEDIPTARLHRSGYILLLVLFFIGLMASSWIVICYLSFRPITAKSYEVTSSTWTTTYDEISMYQRNQEWFRAARVIQSIAGVLTIPLTSTVCSSAAVIYIQKRASYGGLSMRQVMILADKGWTDVATYLRIIPCFSMKGWKRYGSSFLLMAIFINILGSIISPLQEVFLSINTIKTPTEHSTIFNLLDIPNQWLADNPDDDKIVVLTRNALSSANNDQRQAQLWQGTNVSCTITEKDQTLPYSCTQGGVTLSNMSRLENPFLAQLPSAYSTGLIQQFLPRINSTAKYQSIPSDEFPKGCDRIDGAFYVNYYNTTISSYSLSLWGLEACMPANVTHSPWKATRDRQDFGEELYLNVTAYDENQYSIGSRNSTFYKITLNTTAGYFELPNYMNGQTAGPLLEKDPHDRCGISCVEQGYQNFFAHDKKLKVKRSGGSSLTEVVNKGPLLTIAMALFGENSFIPDQLAASQAYADRSVSNASSGSTSTADSHELHTACASLAPLGLLMEDSAIYDPFSCVQDPSHGIPSSDEFSSEVVSWLELFQSDEELMSNVFTAAAFLANQAWMQNNVESMLMSLMVNFDMGLDTQIPVISRAGLILISILLTIDFLVLLSLAIYATITPRWTSTMDSFTMIRMGAAVADKVPLLVGRQTDKIDVLDAIPGCVGDQSDESDLIGKLGLGAPRPLDSRKNKRFESYVGDKEAWDGRDDVWIHRRIYEEGRRNLQV